MPYIILSSFLAYTHPHTSNKSDFTMGKRDSRTYEKPMEIIGTL